MIFPTTFILTFILTQVGLVVAEPVQGKTYYGQSYDGGAQTLVEANVVCKNPNNRNEHLEDIPGFPFIGGVPNAIFNTPSCNACWKITNRETGKSLYFTAVDASGADDFVLSKIAYRRLGGRITTGSFDATAEMVDDESLCANQHTH